jgi:deazaflavin-dependent oxidoreductase (nitroreductase family)
VGLAGKPKRGSRATKGSLERSWPRRALTTKEWNQTVIDEFRAHNGQVGDTFEGSRLLILTSTGARTGRSRTNPTVYLPDGDRFIIFATSGGRPQNPAWYHNLKANPRARVEVGTETFEVTAEEITGPERDRLYRLQTAADPSFAEYERKTARKIPVMALRRVRTPGDQAPHESLPRKASPGGSR